MFLRAPRQGADLHFVDVTMFALVLWRLKCLKNSVRLEEGLQLILNFVFLRKLLPQTSESYIKALQIESHCVKTVYSENK